LITGAFDNGPSGIATYSQTGAQFGYAMCWVMLFCFPLMAAVVKRAIGMAVGGPKKESRRRRALPSAPYFFKEFARTGRSVNRTFD
jgi:Mn2+/Fe2+ NRAMP family transporter